MPTNSITEKFIQNKIYFIRGQKVMLDQDLAGIYGVATGNLNKAVKRNIDRFPLDFMFQLTKEEYDSLRFQIGILKRGAHSKYMPYVFTEQGVAMLSTVLNSKKAIQVNIAIMRVFVQIRDMLAVHKEFADKLKALEKKVGEHHMEIQAVFEVLKRLMDEPKKSKTKIGFHVD